ncbi:polyprenyl synthetase family protein [Mariniluteicoccus endophyticus]
MSLFDPASPTSPALREAVSSSITRFIDGQRPQLAAMGDELETLADLAALFTGGGKRLRPAFAVWGYTAAAGLPDEADAEALVTACASLDVLHVSALVHDDVMDGSDTRRGVPAAHRQLETMHGERALLGSPEKFGHAGAILLGDLLVMWSVEMLERAGLSAEALARGQGVVEAMRTEVTCGQYLDVLAQHLPWGDPQDLLARAHQVVEHKTARYTVQRPSQFGAAIGGASAELMAALAAYGSPLGRAFQFRDDVLGVFGDEATTGKPAGDDLREGKRTVLVAEAMAGTDGAGRTRLAELLGDPGLTPDQVDEARGIIRASGALERVDATIDRGLGAALAALEAPMTEEGRRALTELAHQAVRRDF